MMASRFLKLFTIHGPIPILVWINNKWIRWKPLAIRTSYTRDRTSFWRGFVGSIRPIQDCNMAGSGGGEWTKNDHTSAFVLFPPVQPGKAINDWKINTRKRFLEKMFFFFFFETSTTIVFRAGLLEGIKSRDGPDFSYQGSTRVRWITSIIVHTVFVKTRTRHSNVRIRFHDEKRVTNARLATTLPSIREETLTDLYRTNIYPPVQEKTFLKYNYYRYYMRFF